LTFGYSPHDKPLFQEYFEYLNYIFYYQHFTSDWHRIPRLQTRKYMFTNRKTPH
jgi:hypothetical protein